MAENIIKVITNKNKDDGALKLEFEKRDLGNAHLWVQFSQQNFVLFVCVCVCICVCLVLQKLCSFDYYITYFCGGGEVMI